MKKRVLANDGLVEQAVEYLEKENFEVDLVKRDHGQILEEIGSFDALLVRSATKVTKEVLEAGTRDGGKLKVVGRGGVGTDNIDLECAKELGVIVKFAPNGNTNATAEHALGLMFAIARKVPFAHHTLKNGVWHKKPFVGAELLGKTLGVIGCGRIGQALAGKARGLGMKVIGYDLYRAFDSKVEYVDKIDEVFKNSDFISLHTGGTKVIVGQRQLKMMKRTAFLVNASRGKNVSEDALFEALEKGWIAGAALDCYETEPKKEGESFVSKLRELDNIVLSAHLGASTRNAAVRTGMEVAEVVAHYLRRGDFGNSVNVGENVEMEGQRIYTIFINHEDVPGMFGKFGTALGELGVNIRENNSRKLGDTVQTVYIVHQRPTRKIVQRLEKIEGVRRVSY